MKNLSSRIRMMLSIVLMHGLICSHAQVQTPRSIVINNNCHGFYEYLPAGYNSGAAQYPLLIFIHGLSQLGDGSSQLNRVLWAGPPLLISNGQFPTSFTVNNTQFSFIIISPQFIQFPVPDDVDSVVNYAVTHYRVDMRRIYLTGMSMGGGATWEYAGDTIQPYGRKLSAIVPVCGASYPTQGRGRVIAKDNLPVWATHNDGDPTVPVTATIDYINYINQPPAPIPAARMTIFHSNLHDAWTQTYDPNYRENGMNVYEWMLQYQRPAVVLPITLSSFDLSLVNDNKNVFINWTVTDASSCAYFTLNRSTDGIHFTKLTEIPVDSNKKSQYSFTDLNPAAGDNFYQLTETGADGTISSFEVKEINVGQNEFDHSIQIYPNPATNFITLRLNSALKGRMTAMIIDAQGRILRQFIFEKQKSLLEQRFVFGSLSPGTYFLEINGPGNRNSIAFTVQ
ncbi:MAG: hypothetical protein C5B59_11595 [Bacteroidetes bacterium]|nr:MAG: hypothetical protein C5B59_11595 [Bacteroidota bacterium]